MTGKSKKQDAVAGPAQGKWVTDRGMLPEVIILLVALLLGAFTAADAAETLGFNYLVGEQLARHNTVASGMAGNPWQYRILANYGVAGVMWLVRKIYGFDALVIGFAASRAITDSLAFYFALRVYRRLRLTLPQAVLGVSMLAWGMTFAGWGSDLQFNSYLDLAFYMMAALLILRGEYLWLIPLTALAAFNRETSGLIPVMGLSVLYFRGELRQRKREVIACVVALAAFAVVFVGLRIYYAPQQFLDAWGHTPGFDMLMYNVGRIVTWQQLLATLGLMPVLALIGYRGWSSELKGLFWGVVPIWLLVHAFASVLAESRLLLVPQALVFIPGAVMFCLATVKRESGPTRA